VPLPAYVNRAGWNADESIVHDAPGYGTTLKAVIVHHTYQSGSSSNDYDCADAGAIVRSIQVYAVTGKGLSDIEYNFLVDKCGTLYEGRKGGVDQLVRAAHTVGFNTDFVGVAVIGDFQTTQVSERVRSVIAQLAAYKLGQFGIDPLGTVTHTLTVKNGAHEIGDVVTLNRIAGHRDADATACPGPALYAQLPAIRTEAVSVTQGLRLTGVTGGRQFGSSYVVRDAATVAWSVGRPADQVVKFEVLVDGKLAVGVAPADRSASVPLAPGRHSVQVRANWVDGTPTVTAGTSVTADKTPPTFPTKPELSLRGGTVSTTSAPVTLSFKAGDNVGLTALAATAPTKKSFATSAKSWSTTVKPGKKTTFRLQATAAAGYAVAASVARQPVLVAETKGKKTGRWTTTKNNAHLGKSALTSSAKNASLSWTFTGRSAALLAFKTRTAGKVAVFVDGKKVATLDLKASKNTYRQAVWTKSWATSAKHTVKIVVAGTRGRPKVVTDGIVYVK
jgi:hypothetical protein